MFVGSHVVCRDKVIFSVRENCAIILYKCNFFLRGQQPRSLQTKAETTKLPFCRWWEKRNNISQEISRPGERRQILNKFDKIHLSVHCWQTDDVAGFEPGAGALGGGLAVTGNYAGKARNIHEMRADLEKVWSAPATLWVVTLGFAISFSHALSFAIRLENSRAVKSFSLRMISSCLQFIIKCVSKFIAIQP